VTMQQCCNVKRVGIARLPRLHFRCRGDTSFAASLRRDEAFPPFSIST
jgi:hypothetical protein